MTFTFRLQRLLSLREEAEQAQARRRRGGAVSHAGPVHALMMQGARGWEQEDRLRSRYAGGCAIRRPSG